MAKDSPDKLKSPSKREFLEAFAAVGGVSAMLTAMDGWGIGFASAAETPPDMTGRSDGTKVLILGAGLAGMTSAYELAQRGYDCQILEARSFAGGRCQSSRAGFTTTEIDGTTRTCDFDEGQYFNHGAWRLRKCCGRDGHRVEDTEPHRLAGRGVVARRSDNTERCHVITLLERVDRTHNCARGEASS